MSKIGIEVDKAMTLDIESLHLPVLVPMVRIFLGHARFYIRFVKDFTKISRPLNKLFEKDAAFKYNSECVEVFETLKEKLVSAPMLVVLDRDLPFELMCDTSGFSIVAVLGEMKNRHF